MAASARSVFLAEPPARYLTRPTVVVDCSMVCAVFFDEPERDEAQRALSGRRLVAPALLGHEFLSVALKKLRKGLPDAVVERALADFADHDIELLPTEPLAPWALARQYDLSAYDAVYLWLAETLKTPLLTFDHKLGAAAQQHLSALD